MTERPTIKQCIKWLETKNTPSQVDITNSYATIAYLRRLTDERVVRVSMARADTEMGMLGLDVALREIATWDAERERKT